ncbi:orotate phosphoribosyltransferase [Oscillospiraceae bacterium OttesenSCG-928-G22]|nr:orotate phosphoribosyltransferase [Oscillospiraceae bacterium OttesenSCG-928-G22]
MDYKRAFIELMCQSGVLLFGDFVTKSGRDTPYFINTGNYKMGSQINALGEYYARLIHDEVGMDFTSLFGPAYKAIPLVSSTAGALYRLYGADVPYAFNRKEEKDHGEGGGIIGNPPKDGDRIVIVEDVVTAGTAVRETIRLFSGIADVSFPALVVSVDRRERGTGSLSALDELRETLGITVYPIVTIYDIIETLFNREINGTVYIDGERRKKIEDYLREYGA